MKYRLLLTFFLLLFLSCKLFATDPLELNREGFRLFKSGNFKEASLKFEEALTYSEDNEIIKKNLALCFNNLAISEANKGNNREALFYFDKLRALNVNNGFYLLNYGNLLDKIGKHDSAIWVYLDALEKSMSPADRKKVLFSISNSYFKQEMYDEAIDYLNQLLNLDSNYPGLYFLLGYSEYKRGKLEDAKEYLELGIEREKGQYLSSCKTLFERLGKEYSVEKNFSSTSLHHFTIQFDGEKADDILDAVLDSLNSAYKEVGFKFNYYIEGKIPVVIYTGPQFQRASNSPRWVAALYDGKIRLPIGDLRYSQERLDSLVSHEFTHCLIYHLSSGKCPAWLNEGFAQMMENRVTDENSENNIRMAAQKGLLIKLDYLQNSFINFKDNRLIIMAYDQSYLLTKYLVDKFGMYTFRNIFEQMRETNRDARSIIEENLYKNYDELLKEFAEYIVK
jgi:tetratricopeptide (TPR) repeat protein